jgi:hypothetical protein
MQVTLLQSTARAKNQVLPAADAQRSKLGTCSLASQLLPASSLTCVTSMVLTQIHLAATQNKGRQVHMQFQ